MCLTAIIGARLWKLVFLLFEKMCPNLSKAVRVLVSDSWTSSQDAVTRCTRAGVEDVRRE
jgi:hypothetical protein